MRTIVAIIVALAVICPTSAQSEWVGNWGLVITGDEASVTAMDTDADGYLYIAGRFDGTISIAGGPELNGSRSVFVARLSPGGAHMWSTASTSFGEQQAMDIQVGPTGKVVVCGDATGSWLDFGSGEITLPGGRHGFSVLFEGDGTPQFVQVYGDQAAETIANSVAFISGTTFAVSGTFTNDIDVAGNTLSSNGERDIFVVTHTTSGGTTAVTSYGGTESEYTPSIDVGPSGDFYLSASFGSDLDIGPITLVPGSEFDVFVARFPSPGAAPTWARAFGNNTAGNDLNVDADGNAFVVGRSEGTFNFGTGTVECSYPSDGFILVFKPTGSEGWGESFEGGGSDWASAIVIEGDRLYVTGSFSYTATFGPFTLATAVAGKTEAFVLTMSTFGAWESVLSSGGAHDSNGLAIAFRGGPIVAGSFRGAMDFDPVDLDHPGDGQPRGFVAALIDPTVGVNEVSPVSSGIIGPATPNPFRTFTRFDLDVGEGFTPTMATVHDVLGRRVRTITELSRTHILWDGRTDRGHAAAAGVYFLRVADGVVAHWQRVTLAR